MNQPPLERKAILLSLILIVLILVMSGSMALYVLSDRSIAQTQMVERAALAIEEHYFDDVNFDDLLQSARASMFDMLDRYSTYYPKKSFEEMDENLTGSYTGIGVLIMPDDLGLRISSVREGGPASKAGLLDGDIIVAVDSISLEGLSINDAINHLRGEIGAEVNLTISRPIRNDRFEVSLIREKLNFIHIPYAGILSDSTLYVRLVDFDAGASEDLEAALDSLLPNNPKGMILDLRGNPGGLFHEAYQTANIFLNKGQFIVGTDGRSRWRDQKYLANGKDKTNGLPLLLLVDNHSASSSEIVAGALQQAGRAQLVGDTTFGKGLVQGFVRYPEGDGLKLTISRYYLDGGVYLNKFDSTLEDIGHGLVPDFYQVLPVDTFFQQSLFTSQYLREFAYENDDKIVEAFREGKLDNSYIRGLLDYIGSKEGMVKSYRTDLAEELEKIAQIETITSETKKAINQLVQLSYGKDRELFYQYSDYILYNMARIAFERKEGLTAAYKEVIIERQPQIQKARMVLAENR